MITIYLNHFLALSRRCGQPGQQHGRFLPARRSSWSLRMWSSRVSCFFTIVTQQIHSFRARGVRAFHFSRTSARSSNTDSRSSGTSCTTHVAISVLIVMVMYRFSICLCVLKSMEEQKISTERWRFSYFRNGGLSKTEIEHSTRRLDTLVSEAFSNLRDYLGSMTISNIEYFHHEILQIS